eukprot:TRINITY_DN3379_c1_g1_i1.p1 TRINITY_DN3379_c1_g1~~TRINITY_DN3379_c1_g1_i1.p1  ORF type:complete len:757 (-),score=389.91 TRINITY_DN3379_c1_g1_i1:111-2342(-)
MSKNTKGKGGSSSSSSSASSGRISSKSTAGAKESSGRISSKSTAGAKESSGRISSKSSAGGVGGGAAAKQTGMSKKKAQQSFKTADLVTEDEELALERAGRKAAERVKIVEVGPQETELPAFDPKKEKKKQRKIEQQLAAPVEIATDATISFASSSRQDEESSQIEVSDSVVIPPFSLNFRGTELFREASVTLTKGFRYGLIGANGSGKSTFLRHFASRKLPGIPEKLDMLHVEQEVDGTDEIAIDAVLSADKHRIELLNRKKELEEKSKEIEEQGLSGTEEDAKIQEELSALYDEIQNAGVESAPHRAASILSGLQFTSEMQVMPTKEFSGGWRMRIALARALFLRPSLLLLDEPTNHLDLHAVIWLQEYLKRWKKTLVIVSHDRAFLNEVCNRIIHVGSLKLTTYKGTFDDFVKASELQKRELKNRLKTQEKAIDDLKRMKHGDSAKGGKHGKGASKQAQSSVDKKEKAVEKMIEGGLVERVKDYVVSFPFPSPERLLEHPVIRVEDVSFSYQSDNGAPPKLIFEDVSFGIGMQSRIALVGPNGCGKSTLLGLLFGKLSPTSGNVSINHNLRIGYFSQHFADQLEMDVTPVQYLQSLYPDVSYQNIRKALGKFGLPGKQHVQSIATLSGGQKNRVLYAKLALSHPDILYLDEPTNHLDMESIEALSRSLSRENFEGAVIIVSHDARLIDSVCGEIAEDDEGQTGQIWVVGNNTIKQYDGDIYDYRTELTEQLDKDEMESAT